jgi:hypothetical protein
MRRINMEWYEISVLCDNMAFEIVVKFLFIV